jgi:MFS family permease
MNGPSPDQPDREQQLAYEPPSPERPASVSPIESALEFNATHPGHDPYAAWKSRDFKLFAAGWIVSLIGQQMQSTAMSYEIYQRTHTAMSLGWIGLVQAIPVLLFALPAGLVADRLDRRKVMIIAQVIAAICAAALALISYRHWDYRWMYIPPMIAGVGFTFSRAARQALLPSLVPEKDFTNAVTWNSSIFETSSVVGPAIGGAMVGWTFAHWGNAVLAYVFTVIGQAGYLLFLFQMRSRPIIAAKAAVDRSFTAGLKFVLNTKVILAAITLDLFAVLLGGANYILPIFADKILHVGAMGYGILRAAPAAGAMSMAFIQAHRPPIKKAGRTLLWAVAGFGLATIGFALSHSFLFSILMLAITGALDNISVVIRHTLVQLKTPDHMRGRVSAVNNIFIGASNELGGAESGCTAEWWGAVRSVLFGGTATLVVVALVSIIWPEIRRFGSLHEATPDDQ